MLFTQPTFWVFFAVVVTLLVWIRIAAAKPLLTRNLMLLAASYWFYGAWDYRFLALIIGVSLQTFAFARAIHHSRYTRTRRLYLTLSVGINIAVLIYFKYANFFVDNLRSLALELGTVVNLSSLDVILPVGISFYVFQTLTYVIDVYAGRMGPSRRLEQYMTYVAFFPQLVAGPILDFDSL
jgi:alginate O-acetyltransferase complex protein AlgI